MSQKDERARYDLHQNSMGDGGYHYFVKPLIYAIKEKILSSALGLDFGCGPTPTLAHLLKTEGFLIDLYDPLFKDEPHNIKTNYDFIICCEVMEHFYNPFKEMEFLKSLLKPNGFLFVMTQLWQTHLNFNEWYYQRDPTHVCFYSERTFSWIRDNCSFSSVEFRGTNLIILSK